MPQPCDGLAEKGMVPAKDAGAILGSRYLECWKDFFLRRGQQTVFMQCPCMCCYDIQAANAGLDM